MPSPLPERPGFLIRDPLRFSDTIAVLPRQLARCLPLFDGDHTDLDLRLALARMTGELGVSELADALVGSLREAGFLEDEAFAELRSTKERGFAESPLRLAAHAGGAYPEGADELAREIDGHLEAGRADALSSAGGGGRELFGVAAPHVAFEGGGACYGTAYASVPDRAADRTFIVLGTSHYGVPDRFGLTAKPFVTPFGQTTTDDEGVAALVRAAPSAVTLEDYCHAVEHSIELQVLFLQRRFGPDVRVLPILCGPLGGAADRPPNQGTGIAAFEEALRALALERAAFWVLGIDLAHVGQRYGDALPATAGEGPLLEVGAADRARLARVTAGDARGFLDAVGGVEDRLHWCGASALQLFLRAAGPLRGRTLRYEQWNIDAGSVVSFAALAFWRAEG